MDLNVLELFSSLLIFSKKGISVLVLSHMHIIDGISEIFNLFLLDNLKQVQFEEISFNNIYMFITTHY